MDIIDWKEVRLHRDAEEIVVEVIGADGKMYLKRLADEEAIDFAHRLIEKEASMGPGGTVLVTFRPDEEYLCVSDSPGNE